MWVLCFSFGLGILAIACKNCGRSHFVPVIVSWSIRFATNIIWLACGRGHIGPHIEREIHLVLGSSCESFVSVVRPILKQIFSISQNRPMRSFMYYSIGNDDFLMYEITENFISLYVCYVALSACLLWWWVVPSRSQNIKRHKDGKYSCRSKVKTLLPHSKIWLRRRRDVAIVVIWIFNNNWYYEEGKIDGFICPNRS